MIIIILTSALPMMSGNTNMHSINKQKRTLKKEVEIVMWPDFFLEKINTFQNKFWGYN